MGGFKESHYNGQDLGPVAGADRKKREAGKMGLDWFVEN